MRLTTEQLKAIAQEGTRVYTEAEISAAIRCVEAARAKDSIVTVWAIFSHLEGRCGCAQPEQPREGTQERYIDQWPKPMFLCTHCDEQTDSDPCQECASVFDQRGENYPPVLRFQVVPAPAQPEQPRGGGDDLAARLDARAEMWERKGGLGASIAAGAYRQAAEMAKSLSRIQDP